MLPWPGAPKRRLWRSRSVKAVADIDCRPDVQSRPDLVNSFALVAYLPGSLGEFLDGLRRELVSGCQAQSHVTILPPRPLLIDRENACQRVCQDVVTFPPFRVEAGAVRMFESTSVVYLEIADGSEELLRLHDRLNTDGLAFSESYCYHPHITLAQDLDPSASRGAMELALDRWRNYTRSRSFIADTVTFVQNTEQNRWIDLADCRLGGMPPKPIFRPGFDAHSAR